MAEMSARLRSYAVSVVAIGIATLLKLALDPFIEKESPFLLYFGAVMFSAWRGGMGPGLFATALAASISDYFFLTAVRSFFKHDPGQNFRLGLFVLEGALISFLAGELRSARQRVSPSVWRRYGVALACVAAAFLFKLMIDPLIEAETPFLLFNLAVMASAWHGGLRPGLVAVLGSALLSDYFFLSPIGSLISHDLGQNLRLGLFVVEGTFISLLSETARRRAEGERDMLIALSPDMLCVIGADGHFKRLNPAFERTLGFTEEDLLARRVSDLVHPDDLAAFASRSKAVADGLPATHLELRFLCRDESYKWVAWSIAPLAGKELYAVGHDTTERRHSEEVLRAQDELLREVIDANPNLIFVKDGQGQYALVNKALADLFGTTTGNLVGKAAADFIDHREDVERIALQDEEVLASGRRKLIPEEPMIDKSTGEVRWFQTVKTPLVSRDGKADRILGVATDITARHQAEEALRLSEEKLRQSQKLEAVGQFAGGIAHDFNNLLTAIIGYSDLLLRRHKEGDPSHPKITQIKQAGERAAELTNQLLAFSRKQVLQPRVFCLNDAVANVSQMLRRLIGEHIDFDMVLRPDCGRIEADPGEIERVLLNLAVNARDAMPKGGKLVIETDNVALSEELAARYDTVRSGPHVTLTVSDTGSGIAPEIKARIFEPFFTTKEMGKGTGLGLSTVYGIVKQSSGSIWVESEVGRGTTFRVYLPRVSRAADALGPEATDTRELPRGGETILLVEDEEMLRRMSREILEECGYQVIEASQGEEALAVAERHAGTIHLLVTDVVMPRMSGRMLAERLLAARPQARVLYMSGYTAAAITDHGALEKGIAFLPKPFTPDGLALKVRETLERTGGRE